jgi:hypothetical protein
MKYVLAALAAGCLVSLTAPALADPAPAGQSAPAPKPAKADKGDKVICTTDLDTGSHLRRSRTCMTRRQRDERAMDDSGVVRDHKSIGDRPNLSAGGPG